MIDKKKVACFLKEIEREAALESVQDDESYCPSDNGNFDDTFEDGIAAGRIEFARELIHRYKELMGDLKGEF